MNIIPHRYSQTGISMVELLIALVLGLFITAGFTQVYISNNQGYRVNEAIARIQENARFAMHFLTRDIRMAGYTGCGGSGATITNTLNNTADYRFDFSTYVSGHEPDGSGWDPIINTSIITSATLGRDILVIKGAYGDDISIVGQPNNAADCANAASHSAVITVSNSSGFSSGDIVVASNCSNTSIFQITSVGGGAIAHTTSGTNPPGNSTQDLGACYAGNGFLTGLTTRTYYIRDNASGQPALFLIDGTDDPVELIEGIEDMQILYGVDTDADKSANNYQPADTIDAANDWGNVVSVRIRLLLRSLEDNITSAPQAYTYNGESVPAVDVGDRRMRRVFSSTVSLRNRVY